MNLASNCLYPQSNEVKYEIVHYNHFMALWILSGTTWVNRYQKGKNNLDLLTQKTVSGSGISWAICKSAPRPRHQYPPHSFLQAGCPSFLKVNRD